MLFPRLREWRLIRAVFVPGVFMQELAQNFQLFRSGGETYKLRFYVGHDGSMIRLASLLGFGKVAPLRWPAMGSEIVMEVSTIHWSVHKYDDTLFFS